MSLESEIIQREIEAALDRLAESGSDGLVRQIRPILLANLARERVQWFIDKTLSNVPSYVACVAEGYSTLHEYLHQLQYERSVDVWSPLFMRMQTWAYNFFLRKGFSRDAQTQELAAKCATDAALNLLKAHFPYDTDFDAWAHTIVRNACRKHIQQAFKKSAVPEDQLVQLDENLAGPDDLLLENQAGEQREELEHALAELTEARRTVIELIYFDELSANEVAQRMGKTVSAIYGLHFRALEDLRKILNTNRDNPNE